MATLAFPAQKAEDGILDEEFEDGVMAFLAKLEPEFSTRLEVCLEQAQTLIDGVDDRLYLTELCEEDRKVMRKGLIKLRDFIDEIKCGILEK